MKKKILMAMLCSIAMVCSALAQESASTIIGGADGETSMVIVDGKEGVKPLVVVNGKMYTKDINSIAPDQIESINVLKGQSATDKYGAKAKDGVVEITLKKKLDVAKALVVIDGKVSTKKYDEVKPADIQSIEVLKGASATAKYGEKGANGVVEITTK